MSLLSEFGNILGQARELRDQANATKEEITSSITDTILQGKNTITDVTTEVSTDISSIKQTATQTTDNIKQSVQDK